MDKKTQTVMIEELHRNSIVIDKLTNSINQKRLTSSMSRAEAKEILAKGQDDFVDPIIEHLDHVIREANRDQKAALLIHLEILVGANEQKLKFLLQEKVRSIAKNTEVQDLVAKRKATHNKYKYLKQYMESEGIDVSSVSDPKKWYGRG